MDGIKRKIPLIVMVVLLVSMLLPYTTIAAIAAPTTFAIDYVEVYRNCYETNDQLYLVTYTCDYAVNPTEGNAGELFVCRLMNGAVQYGSTVPYPFEDDGYTTGIMSMYFTAAEVAALGMGFGAATGYTIKFQGNPTLTWAAGVPPSVQTSTFNLWYDTGVILDTQARLTVRLRTLATVFSNDWGYPLLEPSFETTVLNPTGEDYFTNSIINLRLICPGLFATHVTPGTYDAEEYYQNLFVQGDNVDVQVYGVNWCAQVLRMNGTFTSTGVTLKLRRTGNPGIITAGLRAAAGGVPTGADLVTGTLNSLLVDDYGNGSWYTISWDSDYGVLDDIFYAIVLRVPAGDVNNYVVWRMNAAGGYDEGSVSTSVNSGTTWSATGAGYPGILVNLSTMSPSSLLIGGITSSFLIGGIGGSGADMMFSVLGRGVQTETYSAILGGRLKNTRFDLEPLSQAVNVPLVWLNGIIWLAISVGVAVAVSYGVGSFRPAMLVGSLMMPIGALLGFMPMSAAILVALMGAGGFVYVMFYRSST